MGKRTHYEVLGVGRNFSSEELRSAYRRMALRYHPDRSQASDSVDRFIEISQAYEVLSDTVRRASYDRLLVLESGKAAVSTHAAQATRARQHVKTGAQARTRVNEVPPPDLDRLTHLFSRGRYSEAERLARQIMGTHPRLAVPYEVMGGVLRARSDLAGAAQMYAYAYQMQPSNPKYARRHEELMEMLSRGARAPASSHGGVGGLVVALGLVLALASYLVMSKEPALLPSLPLVSTWTLGLVMGLFISGIVTGASLSHCDLLDRFQGSASSTGGRPSATIALAFVAVVNFWAAALMYIGIGQSQNAYQYSTSRLLGASAVTTLLLALSTALGGSVDPIQTLLWGGNLTYLGALCGWMVADSMR